MLDDSPTSSGISTVATVLTVYGIETEDECSNDVVVTLQLQQCLPFTVLKQDSYKTWVFCRTSSCNSAYRLRY